MITTKQKIIKVWPHMKDGTTEEKVLASLERYIIGNKRQVQAPSKTTDRLFRVWISVEEVQPEPNK